MGYAEVVVDVTVTPAGSTVIRTLDAVFGLPTGGLDGTAADTITAELRWDGGTIPQSLTLHETDPDTTLPSPDSRHFRSADGQWAVSVVREGDPSLVVPGEFTGDFVVIDLSSGEQFPVTHAASADGISYAGDWVEAFSAGDDPVDYTGASVDATPRMGQASGPGEFHPVVLGFDGPASLLQSGAPLDIQGRPYTTDDEPRVTAGKSIWVMGKDDETGQFRASTLILKGWGAFAKWRADTGDEWKDWLQDRTEDLPPPLPFYAGFTMGVGGGAVSLLEGVVELGVSGGAHMISTVEMHIDGGSTVGGRFVKDIGSVVAMQAKGTVAFYGKLWELRDDPVSRTLLVAAVAAKDAPRMAQWLAPDDIQPVLAHSQMIMAVGGAMEQIIQDVKNDPAYEGGYIVGRVVFEVASMFIGVGEVAAVAKLSKVQLLARLGERLDDLMPAKVAVQTARAAAEVAETLFANMCFAPGTPVITPDGPTPIEELEPGDLVWATDEIRPADSGWRPIVETFVTHPSRLYQIRTGLDPPPGRASLAGLDALSAEREEILVATAPHPFFVWSRPSPAFVAAEDLRPGDRLRLAGGGSATVLAVSVEEAPAGETFTAHNLHVAEYHTYHVGRHGVWVHNFSAKFCNDLRDALNQIKDDLNIGDLFGERFRILERYFESQKASKVAIDAPKGNFAMHVAVLDDIRAYAQRYPNGRPDGYQGEIPSYERQKSARTFGASNYEIHHLVESRISAALGIPEFDSVGRSIWNASPAIDLPERPGGNAGFTDADIAHYREKFGHDPVYHRGPDGIKEAIDQVFRDLGLPTNLNTEIPPTQKVALLDGLRNLYKYDPRFGGCEFWPVTRDWLRNNAPFGLEIPD